MSLWYLAVSCYVKLPFYIEYVVLRYGTLWYVISRLCTMLHCDMLCCIALWYGTLRYLLAEIQLHSRMHSCTHSLTD